jgi:ABC-type uncharacterized transport system substrate-binding protein
MHDYREYVEAGGLMSYGPNFPAFFRRAADFVDMILRGAKPGDIPVEQPTKFDLVINLTTAQALELTIPPMLLAPRRLPLIENSDPVAPRPTTRAGLWDGWWDCVGLPTQTFETI